MKWPVRRETRSRAVSRSTARYTHQTPGAAPRSSSRYARLRAEQETTSRPPDREDCRIRSVSVRSHGARSASSRERPAAILAMFAAG